MNVFGYYFNNDAPVNIFTECNAKTLANSREKYFYTHNSFLSSYKLIKNKMLTKATERCARGILRGKLMNWRERFVKSRTKAFFIFSPWDAFICDADWWELLLLQKLICLTRVDLYGRSYNCVSFYKHSITLAPTRYAWYYKSRISKIVPIYMISRQNRYNL